jgi:hypothetical protein
MMKSPQMKNPIRQKQSNSLKTKSKKVALNKKASL